MGQTLDRPQAADIDLPAEAKAAALAELQAEVAAKQATLEALEIEASRVRAAQVHETSADRLLELRVLADALPLRLTAARFAAKQAELTLLDASAPEEWSGIREHKTRLEAADEKMRAAQAEKLAVMREGAHLQHVHSVHKDRRMRLREDVDKLAAELREQSTSQERRRTRGTLGWGANG